MGRWSWSIRNTVEECRSIDIPWLKQKKYFNGFMGGTVEWKINGKVTSSIGIQVSTQENDNCENYIRMFYAQTDNSENKTNFDYNIRLVTTPCNLGGFRYWFICPLIINGNPCGKRVSKLYLPSGGKYFGCRHCYNLTYQCQKEHDKKVDFFLKNPELIMKAINTGQALRGSIAPLKAYYKLTEKL